ncbi:imelysin family protein [Polyangium jinanense]|uniref:Iron-regulated protein n=1 Tax=Polyangium jinanense TaxID=2829994 RepID=A0A9X3X735_9BACT|nr:imelysin family protein [Polyangium jinanense]MDC3960560.1 iron-regulated protein [Polyangium jinanense]MDC3985422.1 iron-regulated protein [Polyangium jinanense]
MTKPAKRILKSAAFVTAVAGLLTGCGSEEPASGTKPLSETAPPIIEAYASLVHDSYAEAMDESASLNASLAQFVAEPSQAKLDAAREQWLLARDPYGLTEAFRFYGGPIDDDDGPEGRINAWPMDEAYVDYVDGNANAGIINDAATYPTIDESTIAELNEKDGEKNIATGYHAIEFLLWGQDLSADGPGQRPYTDYVVDMGTAANQERRGQYLLAAGKLLLSDLGSVSAEWAPEGGAYRASFVALPPEEALRRILLGLGSLSGAELAGERMQVAWDTKEQEDEHSCFSDNTHKDLLNNARGIQNVYLGRFGQVDRPGLDELVRERDPALDARLQEEMEASIAAIEAIGNPFDQAILGDDTAPGRQKVKAAIDALRKQTTSIIEVATLLGIELNIEE